MAEQQFSATQAIGEDDPNYNLGNQLVPNLYTKAIGEDGTGMPPVLNNTITTMAVGEEGILPRLLQFLQCNYHRVLFQVHNLERHKIR